MVLVHRKKASAPLCHNQWTLILLSIAVAINRV
jgi:hypothetical protein